MVVRVQRLEWMPEQNPQVKAVVIQYSFSPVLTNSRNMLEIALGMMLVGYVR